MSIKNEWYRYDAHRCKVCNKPMRCSCCKMHAGCAGYKAAKMAGEDLKLKFLDETGGSDE